MKKRIFLAVLTAVLLWAAGAFALQLPAGSTAVPLEADSSLTLTFTAPQTGTWVLRGQADSPVSLDGGPAATDLYALRQLSAGETWSVTLTPEQTTEAALSLNGFTWSLTGDALWVEAFGAMPDLSGHDTPWQAQANAVRTLTVGPGTTAIPAGCFAGLRQLTGVTLPFVGACDGSDQPLSYIFGEVPASLRSVTVTGPCTAIPQNAFWSCNQLISVTLAEGITVLGKQAFEQCTGLQQVILPPGLLTIGDSCFYHCDSLKTLSLPDSVTGLGEAAFRACGLLEEITLSSALTALPKNAFRGCVSLKQVRVPEGVTGLGSYAFCECASLAGVTLPDSLMAIGESCFRGCVQLETIDLPAGLTSLGSGAFRDCTALSGISLPAGITALATYTFSGCTLLREAALPGVTAIGSRAFADSGLAQLIIPLSMNYVATDAFRNTGVVLVGYPGSMAQVCAERDGLSFRALDTQMTLSMGTWQLFTREDTLLASLILSLPDREGATQVRVTVLDEQGPVRPQELLTLTEDGALRLSLLPVETALRVSVRLVIPWQDPSGTRREAVVGEGWLDCVCRVPLPALIGSEIDVTVLGRTSARASWAPVSGADVYEVHCCPLGEDAASPLILTVTEPACRLTGLTPLQPYALYVYPRKRYGDGSLSQLPQQAECVSFTPRLMDFDLAAGAEAAVDVPLPLLLTMEGAEAPDAWQEATVTVDSQGDWRFSGGMLLMLQETEYRITVTSLSCERTLTLQPGTVPVLTLPSDLRRMEQGALSGVPGGVLVLPEGMVTLSPDALSGCGGLLAVYLPESLCLGEEDPFRHCPQAVLVTAAATQADWAAAHGHVVMLLSR